MPGTEPEVFSMSSRCSSTESRPLSLWPALLVLLPNVLVQKRLCKSHLWETVWTPMKQWGQKGWIRVMPLNEGEKKMGMYYSIHFTYLFFGGGGGSRFRQFSFPLALPSNQDVQVTKEGCETIWSAWGCWLSSKTAWIFKLNKVVVQLKIIKMSFRFCVFFPPPSVYRTYSFTLCSSVKLWSKK